MEEMASKLRTRSSVAAFLAWCPILLKTLINLVPEGKNKRRQN